MQTTTYGSNVEELRRFNRFYTATIGALAEAYLESGLSLTEARLIFEIGTRGTTSAATLSQDLNLNPGYLSRLLRRLQHRELLDRRKSERDGREREIRLTNSGVELLERLQQRSREQNAALLEPLSADERRRLVRATHQIQALLGDRALREDPFVIRTHEPGDLGWIVEQHGLRYWQEYGWDQHFEALVAQICSDFLEHVDPSCERCWIAELNGERVGSVMLIRHPDRPGVAKLRLLLVLPAARGMGLGRQLVAECERFAQECGYQAIALWTNDVLISARRIYETGGYHLIDEEPYQGFGHDLVSQTWEKML